MGIIDTLVSPFKKTPVAVQETAAPVVADTSAKDENEHSRAYRRRRASAQRVEKAVSIYAEIEEVIERIVKEGGSPSQTAVALALLIADNRS